MQPTAYTVLLVEDSPIILERVSDILTEVACITEVKRASSFEDAVLILGVNTINVTFLDINLPGENGIELLRFIKENYPSVKAIMLTNQSDFAKDWEATLSLIKPMNLIP